MYSQERMTDTSDIILWVIAVAVVFVIVVVVIVRYRGSNLLSNSLLISCIIMQDNVFFQRAMYLTQGIFLQPHSTF